MFAWLPCFQLCDNVCTYRVGFTRLEGYENEKLLVTKAVE